VHNHLTYGNLGAAMSRDPAINSSRGFNHPGVEALADIIFNRSFERRDLAVVFQSGAQMHVAASQLLSFAKRISCEPERIRCLSIIQDAASIVPSRDPEAPSIHVWRKFAVPTEGLWPEDDGVLETGELESMPLVSIGELGPELRSLRTSTWMEVIPGRISNQFPRSEAS
jgi:hypothetical protein